MNGLRWHAAILPALLCVALANAQQSAPASGPASAATPAPGHEVLNYAVEWRLIPAGTARFSWTTMPASSTAASEVRLHLESAGLVSRLFRVNDDYTALMGQNFCAQTTFMASREGSRNRETRVIFDQQTRKARYLEKDLVKNSSSVSEVEIPPCVHDVLGGLMTLRTLHLEPGKTVQLPVSDGKKSVQVKIESQRREEITTPLGPRKTIRYEIFLFDNVLYKRSGHLHVWLTDDEQRLPVQLQVHMNFTIGTITLRMEKEESNPTATRGN